MISSKRAKLNFEGDLVEDFSPETRPISDRQKCTLKCIKCLVGHEKRTHERIRVRHLKIVTDPEKHSK